MEGCIFCKIASGKMPSMKVAEGPDFLAFLDINPINPGHTLIIPKRHCGSVFGLGEGEYRSLFEAARSLEGPLLKATGARRVGMIVEGFLVPHAHLHLVPLNGGGELSFSRAKKASQAELEGMLSRIRAQV